MTTVKRAALWFGSSFSMIAMTACSAPTVDSFSMTAGPAEIRVQPGGQARLIVSATTTASKPSTAAIVLYYLPAGVTASPASPTVTTGSSTTITLSAAPGAPIGVISNVQVSGITYLAEKDSYINVGVVGSQ